MENYYFYGNLCSWFYDIDKPFPNKKDLDFYLSFVDKGMNILEPMCGSGRFLVSFIEKGFDIDGFDLSKDMIERCKKKIEELDIKYKNLLQCCDFNEFISSKNYDFIFIPSCSFSLIIKKIDIINKLKILEKLNKQNGKLLIELLINEDIGKSIISDVYSRDRVVKQDNFEIVLSYKTIGINEEENVKYSIFKYELYENGIYIRAEEEKFNVKYYIPSEFENYLEKTSYKIVNKFINNEKEKYMNQKIEKIIYELIKE